MSRRTVLPSRSTSASPRRRRSRVTALSQSTRRRKPGIQHRTYEATTPLPPVSLGGYPFPVLTTQWTKIPHQAGLFAILERVPTAEAYRPLLLGEAADMHEALATLSYRVTLPAVNNRSVLVYAALATNVVRAARQHIVTTLRTLYQLPTLLAPVLPQGGMVDSPPRFPKASTNYVGRT